MHEGDDSDLVRTGWIGRAHTRAANLLGRPLEGEPHGGLRCDFRSSQPSILCRLWDSTTERFVIYKERHLSPVELVEIEVVLDRLQKFPTVNVCRVLTYEVTNHRLALLLEEASGQSLDHAHDDGWRNDTFLREFLRSLRLSDKLAIAIGMAKSIAGLHSAGLLCQDLKIEQFVVSEDYSPTMVDVDTIILEGGYCARHPQWASAGSPLSNSRSASVETDLFSLGVSLYELFYDDHWWSRRVEMGTFPGVDDVLRYLLGDSKGISASDAVLMLADLIMT